MLFQVKMKVIPPTNLSEEEFSDIKAKEKQYAKELQKAGVWLHLWRVVGLYTNISIFEVEDNAHLHNDCGDTWEGIDLQSTKRKNGKIEMYGKCSIENVIK